MLLSCPLGEAGRLLPTSLNCFKTWLSYQSLCLALLQIPDRRSLCEKWLSLTRGFRGYHPSWQGWHGSLGRSICGHGSLHNCILLTWNKVLKKKKKTAGKQEMVEWSPTFILVESTSPSYSHILMALPHPKIALPAEGQVIKHINLVGGH